MLILMTVLLFMILAIVAIIIIILKYPVTLHKEFTVLNSEFPSHTSKKELHLNPERICLLNWNIYKNQHLDWSKDFTQFIEHCDLITLQEAHLNEHLQSVFTEQQLPWMLNSTFLLRRQATGVMTATRYSVLKSDALQHIEPLLRIPKSCLISYIPIQNSDQTLLLANIHAINFTPGLKTYRQQILSVLTVIDSHQGPVIFVGDFNSWSPQRMALLKRLTQASGLITLNYSGHIRSKAFGLPLDHIFFRSLKPLLHHSWAVDSSDHNPTHVIFKVVEDSNA